MRASASTGWPLFHGTTTSRLVGIRRDDQLRVSPSGDPKIALTPARSVAEYFACCAVFGDRHDAAGEPSEPIVLVLDGEALVYLNYPLIGYSGPEYGEGGCDWENEIACWEDIDPLSEVLIRVEAIAEDRLDLWRGRASRALFQPPKPWICQRIRHRVRYPGLPFRSAAAPGTRGKRAQKADG